MQSVTSGAVSNALAQTLIKVASKQSAHEFQSIDNWETVDSITLGSGNFLVVFRMNWNYSKPIAIQIENVAPTLVNTELLGLVSIICCIDGGRTINFKAKGDAVGINNYYYCVYKVD